MKKSLLILMFVCFATVSFQVDVFAFFKSTKFTVVVVSEKDEPLERIKVGVGFEKNTGWSTDSTGQQGITDSEGRLTFSGQSNGHITFGGSREGYYPSYYDFDFRDLGPFGWQPWNPELKIVMRKIENPVPMYARDTKDHSNGILTPVAGENLGFDLIEYDWVAPYGKGKEADFIFNLSSTFSGNRNFDFEVKIKFNNGNGIIKYNEDLSSGSEFNLPRYAPEDDYGNYLDNFVRRSPNGPMERSDNKNNHYIFRVRSVMKDGKVERAMYGKILRDIVVHPLPDGRAKIAFQYYLNPDGTRNLEFDPKRNLFGDLPPLEQVGIK